MKKVIFNHLFFFLSFFVFISLKKGWVHIFFWPFWVGGVLGWTLPISDHFLYVFFLRPQEWVSQRIIYLFKQRKYFKAIQLLLETRKDRVALVFHTIYFQLILLVLTFWVITSSGSLLGQGLVLAFTTHLFLDQIISFSNQGLLEEWLGPILLTGDKKRIKAYLAVIFLTILLFIFIL